MPKRQKKDRQDNPQESPRVIETPPGATRKALDRKLEPGGGPPGSAAGPRHASDDEGTESESTGILESNWTPGSPTLDEEDPMEKGPPYASRSGSAVGGTPAQGRSVERPARRGLDPSADIAPDSSIAVTEKSRMPSDTEDGETMRLTGFEAIEYAEKQGLALNKHPDSINGSAVGLDIGEATAIADEDPDLIWLDVDKDEYYDGSPTDFEPER